MEMASERPITLGQDNKILAVELFNHYFYASNYAGKTCDFTETIPHVFFHVIAFFQTKYINWEPEIPISKVDDETYKNILEIIGLVKSLLQMRYSQSFDLSKLEVPENIKTCIEQRYEEALNLAAGIFKEVKNTILS